MQSFTYPNTFDLLYSKKFLILIQIIMKHWHTIYLLKHIFDKRLELVFTTESSLNEYLVKFFILF